MEKKPNIKTIISSEKSRVVLIIVALIAAAFLFFGNSSDKETDLSSFDADGYQNIMSQKVLDMVTSVKGSGNAKVLLTLEDSYEYVYLDDGKTLRKINEPTIRGVVVACDGGDSPTVCSEITELLTTVLNIPSTKVCVTKLI